MVYYIVKVSLVVVNLRNVAVAPRAQHQPGLRAHLRGLGPGRRQGQHTEGGRGAVRQGDRGQDEEGQLTLVHMKHIIFDM